MSTAYSPENNKGRESVKHLCTADSTFTAPTTFPTCHSKQVPQRFIPFLRCIPRHCCSNTFETRNSPTRKGWNPNKKSLIGELVAPLDYADSHAKVMSAIADLHIISYDMVFSKGGHVLLRYSAEGSHCGQPHNGIEPSGKKAKWTAAAIFEVKDGKVHSFTKEWDKLNMWKQLGWVSTISDLHHCLALKQAC